MKALVILNTILEDEEYENMECVASSFKKTYFGKAIVELEALQQHIKTLEAQLANTEQLTCCDSCKCMNDLYNDLDTIKWWSAVEGDAWDSCIDAVRDCIKKDYLSPKDTQ